MWKDNKLTNALSVILIVIALANFAMMYGSAKAPIYINYTAKQGDGEGTELTIHIDAENGKATTTKTSSTKSSSKNSSKSSSKTSKDSSGKGSSDPFDDSIDWEDEYDDYWVYYSDLSYPDDEIEESEDYSSEPVSSEIISSEPIQSEPESSEPVSSEGIPEIIPIKSERNQSLIYELTHGYGVQIILAESEYDYYLEAGESFCTSEENVYLELLCLKKALDESPRILSEGYTFLVLGSFSGLSEDYKYLRLKTEGATSVSEIKTAIYRGAKQTIADMLALGKISYNPEGMNPYGFYYSKYNDENLMYVLGRGDEYMVYFANEKCLQSEVDELFEIYKMAIEDDRSLLIVDYSYPLYYKLNLILEALAEFDDNVKKSALYDRFVTRYMM